MSENEQVAVEANMPLMISEWERSAMLNIISNGKYTGTDIVPLAELIDKLTLAKPQMKRKRK